MNPRLHNWRTLLKDKQARTKGKGLCCWCEQPITAKSRRTWCSDKCVEEYRLLTDWGFVRRKVLERDQGICQMCGMDCIEAKQIVRAAKKQIQNYSIEQHFFKWLGIPSGRQCGDLWDADHIIPVAEGGGACGLENLRTLCIWCHKKETAALRKRLAAKGKQQQGELAI